MGEVTRFAGHFEPRGWAFADGRLLSIDPFQLLFSVLGTTYGGDGETNFALPDLRGRVAMHRGAGLTDGVGDVLGTESFTLTEANLPSHSHTAPVVPEPATAIMVAEGFLAMVSVTARR